MRLLKWTSRFDIKEESHIAPIWIGLSNLKVHFINHQVLFAIAALLTRPSLAQILVELDISKSHPKQVLLGTDDNGYFQEVVFENLHVFCSHCKLYGHTMGDCFFYILI